MTIEQDMVTEVEREVNTDGHMADKPPTAIGAELQTWMDTHTAAESIALARAVGDKLCEDGYFDEANAWYGHAYQLEVLASLNSAGKGLVQ